MRKSSLERLIEWAEKIKMQKFSNKSSQTWCREYGISYYKFQYWQKRIKKCNQSSSVEKRVCLEPT